MIHGNRASLYTAITIDGSHSSFSFLLYQDGYDGHRELRFLDRINGQRNE